MRKLCLLGSTGSIGTQTIDVIGRLGGFEVYSLAARSSIDRLEEQTRTLRPKRVCVFDEEKAGEFRKRTADLAVDVVSGMEGLIDLASDPANDLTVTALVGMIGIRPPIAAIEAGCDILAFGNNLRYEPDLHEQAFRAVWELYREGSVSRGRLEQSWRRIEALMAGLR